MDTDTIAERTPTLHSASLHAVAVFTCDCGRGPLVITGVSEMVTCPACASRWTISQISHEPKPNGEFETNVQIGKLSNLALPAKRRQAFEIISRSDS